MTVFFNNGTKYEDIQSFSEELDKQIPRTLVHGKMVHNCFVSENKCWPGHFFIEVDHVKFKISLGKHPIKSWKEYRKYKKENNTFYYLETVGTLNTKSKIIARYETLEDFISEFPTISSLYVKQGKTENRIDKLMEDF